MTTDHLKNVLEAYKTYLRNRGYKAHRKPDEVEWPDDPAMVLNHCVWMCEESLRFLDNGDFEKARGWLCFIQCCLWYSRMFTVEQMREHSRPPERGGTLAGVT